MEIVNSVSHRCAANKWTTLPIKTGQKDFIMHTNWIGLHTHTGFEHSTCNRKLCDIFSRIWCNVRQMQRHTKIGLNRNCTFKLDWYLFALFVYEIVLALIVNCINRIVYDDLVLYRFIRRFYLNWKVCVTLCTHHFHLSPVIIEHRVFNAM